MRDWRLIVVEGEFSLAAPPDAEWRLDEGDSTFVLRMPSMPVTEILISRHGRPTAATTAGFLEGRVRRFLSEQATRASGSELGATVKEWRDANNIMVVQGVATDGEGDWWFVRGYDVGNDYFLLLWTGPAAPLESDVLRVFESFVPASRWLPKVVTPGKSDFRLAWMFCSNPLAGFTVFQSCMG